jgi:hypothetical protein
MRPVTRVPSLLLLATAVCALGLVLVLAAAGAGTVVLSAVFALLCILASALRILPPGPVAVEAARRTPFTPRAPPVS